MSFKIISLLILSTLSVLNAATPIASYHFDEPGWASGSKVYDSSRERNHITALNGVTRTSAVDHGVDFKVCQSAKFDGIDDYMIAQSSDGLFASMLAWILNFFGFSGNSEALWYQSSSDLNHDNNATLISRNISKIDFNPFTPNNINYSTELYLSNGKICSKSIKNNVTQNIICTKDASYKDTLWHHVTHTTNSFSVFFIIFNFEYLYIDGEQKAKKARFDFTGFSPNVYTKYALLVGTSSEQKYFNGYIDEVNLFDDDISQNEINNLVNQTRACPNAGGEQNTSVTFDVFDDNISSRQIYTKIVNKPFSIMLKKTDGAVPTDTNITVSVKAVPSNSCPNDSNEIMTNTIDSTWTTGDSSKTITFESGLAKASRDSSMFIKLSTTSPITTIVDIIETRTKPCSYCICGSWSTWAEVSSCSTSNCLSGTIRECRAGTKNITTSSTALSNTCSTDNFAIRPKDFSSPTFANMTSASTNPKCFTSTGKMIAGCDYKLIIDANGSDGTNAIGYNQAYSNTVSEITKWVKLNNTGESNVSYVKSLGGRSGEFIQNTIIDTNFTDGHIEDVNYSYSEVGEFYVSMVDRDWAKVDITDNNPDENASVIMTTKRFRVAPYEFNISVNQVVNVDFNTDTNISRFTYLSNKPYLMGARGRIQVDALNARGEVTQNYTTGLYENNAKLYIKINKQLALKDANLSFGALGVNDWYSIGQFAAMTDGFDGFVKGSLFFNDPNSAHFNYERNKTNYTNTPFLVDGKDIDVNITDNDSILYKDGNFSHPEGNVTFFYGRVNAIDGRVLPSNKENLGLFVEIYCDNESTDCSAYDVNMTNSPTDLDWYLHFEHNESSVEKFNDITLVHPRLGTFTDVNITNMYGSKDSLVKAYYGSTIKQINYNADNTFINGESNITIGYTGLQSHTTHIRVTPVTWLEHTSQFKSPILRFKVTFPGNSGDADNQKNKRAGMGKEGDSNKHMDSNSSKVTNRRMSW